jgi:TrmH family RNA methyltransferase
VKPIASAANPRFREWLRIAGSARALRESGLTLAEGLHLAQAALEARTPVAGLVLRQGARHTEVEFLQARFDSALPRWELAAPLYERIAPVEQGAGILLLLPVPAPALPRALAADMLYLDGVQDPGNVGALLRSAAAAGVRHVLAGPGTAALWAPRVLRAAMGAHLRLNLYEHVEPAQLAGVLDGPWFAAVAHGGRSLWDAPLEATALGWILGGEGAGLSPEALARAQEQVVIPTSGAVESLNVAAAGAVCLFERRRRVEGTDGRPGTTELPSPAQRERGGG